jgi:hypothetical protein
MTRTDPRCIDPRVDPLLTELREPVGLHRAGPGHPARPELQGFVRDCFRRAHGARVEHFYPELLCFTAAAGIRAVVGYRGALGEPLFSEHYLDLPADERMTAIIGEEVPRDDIVEVGNLALSDPGQARWIIAATTAFLAAAGYRWVLFTATRPLANAFRRLGLRPLWLADADPARLPDGGAAWGAYYRQGPAVYAGDILAGAAKLQVAGRGSQPSLQSLLGRAWGLGTAADTDRTRVLAS